MECLDERYRVEFDPTFTRLRGVWDNPNESYSWFFQKILRERDKDMDLGIIWTWVKYHHLWLAIKQTRRTIVTNGSIGSQRPRTKYILKISTLPTHASFFLRNLSYFTKCMHPPQMNGFSRIFDSYLHPRDTKTSDWKISTKYLE
jgi:hypothetical protein